MHRTARRVAIPAALLALLAAVLPASPASAHHDPSPPYVASSQPGGYPLYGFHHDQMSPTVHAWSGIQRRSSDGFYRLWFKVQGDGRQGSVEFRHVSFYDHGIQEYRACDASFCVKGPGTTVYYTGGWHPVVHEVSVKALYANWRYTGGASTGGKCLSSYRMAAGSKFVIANPTC